MIDTQVNYLHERNSSYVHFIHSNIKNYKSEKIAQSNDYVTNVSSTFNLLPPVTSQVCVTSHSKMNAQTNVSVLLANTDSVVLKAGEREFIKELTVWDDFKL